MRLAKTIRWNQVKSGADAEKQVSDDAKKAIAETTQLLENVVEQLSKSDRADLRNTQDAKSGASSQGGAYTGAQQREREGWHQVEEFRSKSLTDRTQQCSHKMVQDLWKSTAWAYQRRAAVETKVEEAAKRGKPEVRNPDKTRGETLFLSDNETKRTMKFTWW